MMPEADRRGRYDRAATPRERARCARRRALLGAAEVLTRGAPTQLPLAAVASQARLSRSTLYQLFGDGKRLAHLAERVAAREVTLTLRGAAATAVTPIERLRALSRAWLDLAARDDPWARLAVRLACDARLSRARGALTAALATALGAARASGLLARDPSPTLVSALAAAWAHVAAAMPEHQREPPISPEALAELTWRAAR